MDTIKTLSIEDDPTFFKFIKKLLERSEYTRYNLSRAQSLFEGSDLLESNKYDVILLDLILPNGEGLKVFKDVQKISNYTPIVILSGHEQLALEAVKEGAQDYIIKSGLTTNTLDRSIRYSIERKMIQDRRCRLTDKQKSFQEEVDQVLEEKMSVWEAKRNFRQNKIKKLIDRMGM